MSKILKLILASLSIFGSIGTISALNQEELSFQIRSVMSENLKPESIRKGADLQFMAKTYYGNSLGWPLVWFFNSEAIPNPEIVSAGTKLKIPRLNAGATDAEASQALENAYILVYNLYSTDGKHSKAQRQWVLGQARLAGMNLKSAQWQDPLSKEDFTWLKNQKEIKTATVVPKLVALDSKASQNLIEIARKGDIAKIEQELQKLPDEKVRDIQGDLELLASNPNAKPEVHFALALTYGRLGLKGKEYAALLRAEAEAQKPGTKFNVLLIYGRKQLLESDIDASKFLVGDIEIISEPQSVEVILNGESKGRTPLQINKAKAGDATLELRSDGFVGKKLNISVDIGKTTKVSETLKISPLEMVKVDGGLFEMGSDNPGSRPLHSVQLTTFKISKKEVNQSLWNSIMGAPISTDLEGKLSVSKVSWYEAIEFCNRLSKFDGLKPYYIIVKSEIDPNNENSEDGLRWTISLDPFADGYRLPTEAQWEFAARGGVLSKDFDFAGSSTATTVAYFKTNSSASAYPSGQKAPNELGIFDMSGNVGEWCYDWEGDYSVNSLQDPLGPKSGLVKIVRGGNTESSVNSIRVFDRSSNKADEAVNGMRIVLPN